MKRIFLYQCGFCGVNYETEAEAFGCEAGHAGLTRGEYREYIHILKAEKKAQAASSTCGTPAVKEKYDRAIETSIRFEKLYGITDAVRKTACENI